MQEIFDKIYRDKVWGEGSGGGSCSELASSYAEAVKEIVEGMDVIDVGFGDLTVTKALLPHVKSYTGIDVSGIMVGRAQSLDHPKVKSMTLGDITVDDPPKGDIILVRQVLQHLSDNHVQKAIENIFRSHQFAIITDEVRGSVNSAKLDTDNLIRAAGLFLELPPFNLTLRQNLGLVSSLAGSAIRSGVFKK